MAKDKAPAAVASASVPPPLAVGATSKAPAPVPPPLAVGASAKAPALVPPVPPKPPPASASVLAFDLDFNDEDILVPLPPPAAKAQETGEVPPVPKAKGRAKARTKKGFKHCTACDTTHAEAAFSENQTVCMEAKKKLDCIFKAAKRQGAGEWFAEARKDEKRTRAMVKHYIDLQKNADPKKRKFDVLQYKETSETEQGVEFRGKGRMMWERQAIEFWKSVDGGLMSEEDAQARWDGMASHLQEWDITHDFGSPYQKKPLRMHVKMFDDMDYYNAKKQRKSVENTEKAIKNAKDEDYKKLEERASSGFDKAGNGSSDMKLQDFAKAMVRGGGEPGAALSGINVALSDVKHYFDKQEEDDDEDNDAASSVAGSDNKSVVSGVSPSPSKNSASDVASVAGSNGKDGGTGGAKWFDVGSAINKNTRTLRAAIEGIKTSHESMCKSLNEAIQEVASLPAEEQELLKGEVAVAKTRLQALELVGGSDFGKLENFKKQFSTIRELRGRRHRER